MTNASGNPIGIKEVMQVLSGSGKMPGGGTWTIDENTLWVGNLPVDTTDKDLYAIFACFGAIAPYGCRVMKKPNKPAGYGLVNFLDPIAAQQALVTVNGTPS